MTGLVTINDALGRAIQHIPVNLGDGTIAHVPVTALQPSDLKIVQNSIPSAKNPLVKDMLAVDMFALVESIINRSKVVLGLRSGKDHEATDHDVILETAISNEILNLIGQFQFYTRLEILSAAEMGLQGKFLAKDQSFVHFSVSNLSIWIKRYAGLKNAVNSTLANIQKQLPKKEVTVQDQIRLSAETVNVHVRSRIANPGYRTLPSATLLDQLVELGIYKPTKEEKQSAYDFVRKRKMTDKSEILIPLAKDELYNRFIKSLADFECILNEKGEQIAIE